MLNSMKWESLKDRRTKAKLTMTYKIINEEVDIPKDKYFSPKQKSSRVTRSTVKISKHSLGHVRRAVRWTMWQHRSSTRSRPTGMSYPPLLLKRLL